MRNCKKSTRSKEVDYHIQNTVEKKVLLNKIQCINSWSTYKKVCTYLPISIEYIISITNLLVVVKNLSQTFYNLCSVEQSIL